MGLLELGHCVGHAAVCRMLLQTFVALGSWPAGLCFLSHLSGGNASSMQVEVDSSLSGRQAERV